MGEEIPSCHPYSNRMLHLGWDFVSTSDDYFTLLLICLSSEADKPLRSPYFMALTVHRII